MWPLYEFLLAGNESNDFFSYFFFFHLNMENFRLFYICFHLTWMEFIFSSIFAPFVEFYIIFAIGYLCYWLGYSHILINHTSVTVLISTLIFYFWFSFRKISPPEREKWIEIINVWFVNGKHLKGNGRENKRKNKRRESFVYWNFRWWLNGNVNDL